MEGVGALALQPVHLVPVRSWSLWNSLCGPGPDTVGYDWEENPVSNFNRRAPTALSNVADKQ